MAKTKGGKKKAVGRDCNSPTLDVTMPKRLKRVSWRDEELENVNIIPSDREAREVGGDLQDPAILMVGHSNTSATSSVRYTYSREVLLKLRHSKFSTRRPDYLDPAHDNNGTWDPERWHMERRASEGPSENGNRGNGTSNTVNELENHRRRPGDPKDRVRREHDGIVLSPQRRSFNSGCFVPVREPPRNNRSHSPIGGKNVETSHIGHREIPQGPSTRRIGSGRIIGSWENQDKYDVDNDFGFRRERRDTDRDRDDRFERRPYVRDADQTGMGPPGRQQQKPGGNKDSLFNRNNNGNNRYGNDNRSRRMNDTREIEEPEWFSEGPTSQHDTIELRGFDDSEKIGGGKKKQTAAQKKKAKELQQRTKPEEGPLRGPPEDKENEQRAGGRATPARKDGEQVGKGVSDKGAPPPEGGPAKVEGQDSFNLDEFLQSDIPMLTNGVGLEGNEPAGGSRFSQWFKRGGGSPGAKGAADSRRSSMQEESHFIKTILGDITEPVVNIPPGDSDSYFAPISPAANTTTGAQPPSAFMEMMRRGGDGKQHHGGPPHGDLPPNIKNEMPGKVLSLEELEAQMRKGGPVDVGGAGDMSASMRAAHMSAASQQHATESENAAFKKLLAQMHVGNVIPASNGPIPIPKAQPMSILEMLTHSQKQDEAHRLAQLMNSANAAGLQGTHDMPNDLTFKLQQAQSQAAQAQRQQLEAFTKLMQSRTPPPINEIGLAASRELLSRPEAQAILQAMHQRIPSPRELQLHTQSIMQKALIKKKLEEQSENFRKKQETQQRVGQTVGGGLSPAKSVSSPTQLAWGTPTSVLRKMTAEKDDGKDSSKGLDAQKILQQQGRALTGMRNQVVPQTQAQQQTQQQQQWNAQFQQMSKQQGRPIVKNNAANFPQAQQMQQHEQFLLQQRLYNQQQQQQQQRKQQQQQQQSQQQQFAGQFNQAYQGQNPSVPQYTQHQLRAQHQARAQHQQQQGFTSQQQQQQQQQQQWIMQSQNFENRQMGGRGGGNDGDMSPTSNQLARWFSPDLLDRARKGKLPNMPPSNLAQHAMSLEEIERQTAPAVHN